jgi:transposase
VHGPSARLAVIAVATSVLPDGESQWSHAMIAGHLAGARPGDLGGHRGPGPIGGEGPPAQGPRLAQPRRRPRVLGQRRGVRRLYLSPPPGTMLISIDEKTGIQAKSRKHPGTPAGQAGTPPRVRVRPPRHHLHHRRDERDHRGGHRRAHREERPGAFTAFLAMLHQMIPPQLRIRLIMDNGSSHTSAATRAWLAAHPRFQVTCTPKHASWLNMIEQWFGVLTRRLLRCGDFASRDDLEAKIIAFTIRHNKNARPYRWSYDADADHARYLERHQPEPMPVLAEAA